MTHTVGLQDTIHVLHVPVPHPILTKSLPEIIFINGVFDFISEINKGESKIDTEQTKLICIIFENTSLPADEAEAVLIQS